MITHYFHLGLPTTLLTFSCSGFSSLGMTEFCLLRRLACFLGDSCERDRSRFWREPDLGGVADPECSEIFRSRCSLSARFKANAS